MAGATRTSTRTRRTRDFPLSFFVDRGWIVGDLTLLAALALVAGTAHGAPGTEPGVVTISPGNGNVAVQVGPAAASNASSPSNDPIERARRGVVSIERSGDVVALGAVLKNDGRILTALSPLGDGNGLDVRYADGSVVRARVGHRDRAWDLALLIPQAGRWPEGLLASDGDPLRSGAQLRAFSTAKARVQPATVVLKSKRSLLGADDQLLRDVFEVTTRLGPKEYGSPVVDETGSVVAVLGRACVPVERGPCVPTAFGVPVEALRAFLRTTPVSAVPPAPWLGIQGIAERGTVQGVRLTSVAPESPADEAGLRGGQKGSSDLLVAIDDQPITTPEALATFLTTKAVGNRVKLLVFGSNGKFREALVLLRPAPSQGR